MDELSWTFQASLTSLDPGPIELLAGDPAAAEHELRRDFDALDPLKERNCISTVAAILADALYGQDRLDEADQMSAFSAEVAAPDDLTTQFLWRGVRGKLLARMTRVEDGLAMLREALALTRRSDEPIAPANALMTWSKPWPAPIGTRKRTLRSARRSPSTRRRATRSQPNGLEPSGER